MMSRLLAVWIAMLLTGNIQAQELPNSVKLVEAARKQIGVTVLYDPAYVKLAYPNGDVPLDRGVCTDVIIRALRDSQNMDLQKLVYSDMKANFSAYPKNWGLKKPDKNIDHRRVPNLQTFLKRNAVYMKPSNNPEDYHAGEIVTCMLPGNLPHIMIVSDRKSISGTPLIIHNIGEGAKEEDRLFEFQLTGHYRLKN